MAALGVQVGLLLALGILGVQLLSDANARSDHLADLQRKSAAYQDLRQNTDQQLSGVAAGLVAPDPGQLASAVRQLSLAGYSVERLSFVAPDEADSIAEVRTIHGQFVSVMARVLELASGSRVADARDLYATQAGPLADRLGRRTDQLVHKAEAETLDSIEESHTAYLRSQLAIAGFGVGSVALALLLGIALSLSFVRPVRAMEARLARIAHAEFSGHVSVDNRDELGTLASGLNRMNDELARLYDEVQSANRHKSEFLANMSHELRTPLNAIIGFSEVLLQKLFGDLNPKQAEYLGDILGSGQHQLALINDILDLSKVEAGKMELEPGPVSIGGLIDSCLLLVRESATRQGVALEAHVDPEIGMVMADGRKLKQVLLNLLSNAVKFTPQGGRVDVSGTRRKAEIVIAVSDTGAGIALEDQERIFEEFQQTRVGQQTEGSTGLGLTLARRLTELHGGRIEVESAVGLGSTFTVYIPEKQST